MVGDFHLHSHHSDGRLDPTALINVVADAGVEIAALTDHDTTAGHLEAATRAAERDIRFVPGIEMTTYAYDRVIHVLGLGIDAANSALQAANHIARDVWVANERRWVDSLESGGENVNFERDFPDHPVRLPLLIERLCRRGVSQGDPQRCHAAFRSFFAALPKEAYGRLATPAQAAATIRQAGGIALLAHPDQLHEAGLLDRLLDAFDGLEVWYAPYSDEQRQALLDVARSRNKLYSVGSDYHGYFTTDYARPKWEVPATLLRRLLTV